MQGCAHTLWLSQRPTALLLAVSSLRILRL
jgi:hypothetical protein